MEINDRAPVVIRREITVFAPPSVVWEWISRVDLWADWHPELSSARWLAAPGPRGWFKLRYKLLGVTANVETWDAHREFGWSGHAWKTKLRHALRLDGDFRSTTIVSEQSLEGPVAAALAPVLRDFAGRWNEVLLAALKTRLESMGERGSGTGARLRRVRNRRIGASRKTRVLERNVRDRLRRGL